jgi:peptidyl-prolyl cis-trans isomerase A (cyclophilin A)
MNVVQDLYSGYGEGAPRGKGPNQGRLMKEGNAYLEAEFDKLDYINRATILED